ncbi:amidase domain-containing protein [Paenibacillus hexagrammi]|uniref:Amidase domain-containing protein n=1 Tax=Paenibacillus hexagrammi TaxID=2908839 RepID=A0ABY3SS94_9BACL|nr:amidase domain-containing protein [Paenibacillus sp. YPD9-1]UJF36129.1 amidase domain-containing protein [Paenibacillus sp. YPD9-1]
MKKTEKALVTCALLSSLTIGSLAFDSNVYAAGGTIMFTNSNSSVNSGYNRTNAANYAKAHATNDTRNQNYASYGSAADGGDCTNFASQILHDGGGLSFLELKAVTSLPKIGTIMVPMSPLQVISMEEHQLGLVHISAVLSGVIPIVVMVDIHITW